VGQVQPACGTFDDEQPDAVVDEALSEKWIGKCARVLARSEMQRTDTASVDRAGPAS
jgi:hypothetical protein